MRISIVPQGPLERVAFALGMVPRPLVLGFWGMGVSRTAIVATRLGVFEALAHGPRSVEDVAGETGCHPEGMETLLNALNGFRFVKRHKGLYRNTRQSKKWLLTSSKYSLPELMFFYDYLDDDFAEIEEGVRTGVLKVFHRLDRSPEFWESYMRSLGGFARYIAKEVVRRVRFDRPPLRLLDAGGGHGVFSMAFAKRYPGLEAEVLDLPEAVGHGRSIVAEAGMADRVKFREGDMRSVEWGGDYDIVLLFNVLHTMSSEEAVESIRRAHISLRAGGMVIVLDSEHVGGGGNLSTASGFNELFFFVINGTRPHPEGTIEGWMREAGFRVIKKKRLLTLPAEVMITGTTG